MELSAVIEQITNILYDHATLLSVAGFIVLMTFNGRSRGFMIKLLSLCSIAGTLILEVNIYPRILELIENNETISGFFSELGARLVSGFVSAIASNAAAQYGSVAGSGDELTELLGLAGSPLYDMLGLDVLAEDAAGMIAAVAGRIVCFILVFLVIRLLFRALTMVARGLKRVRLIDWLDTALGGILGFVEGLVYVWLAMFVVSGFPGYFITDLIISQITGSIVLRTIYSSNLIIKLFIGMLL